jgi:hypothetical protein
MATATPQPEPATPEEQRRAAELTIYGHSNFFYWWPVWLVGYIMAGLTFMADHHVKLDPNSTHEYLIHPNKYLGVVYTFVFFIVIMTTNVSLKGIYSAVAILVALVLVLLAAYFDWWPYLVGWFGQLDIYMNMGFYVFFSTLIFLVWAANFFIFDRLTYWKLTPGQLTQEYVIGGAAKSWDTRGMVFEKVRQDLFRNWVLGFGSGEIKISTMGAHRETFAIDNVLFVDAKVSKIQELIALHQQAFTAPVA